MKGKMIILLNVMMLLIFQQGWTATTATALVTFSISPIINISISGNPGTMIVSGGTATYDTSTTYGVSCNMISHSITGMIDTLMPPGVTLSVELQGPSTSTSTGNVDLTTTPQNLVDNICHCCESDLMIKYTLAADINAVPIASASRIITYTIGP